jgi:hypothetical protein
MRPVFVHGEPVRAVAVAQDVFDPRIAIIFAKGKAGSAYNQAEVEQPAEAHSSLRAVRPLKPEQILYSDLSTR